MVVVDCIEPLKTLVQDWEFYTKYLVSEFVVICYKKVFIMTASITFHTTTQTYAIEMLPRISVIDKQIVRYCYF